MPMSFHPWELPLSPFLSRGLASSVSVVWGLALSPLLFCGLAPSGSMEPGMGNTSASQLNARRVSCDSRSNRLGGELVGGGFVQR